jgi:hypothetical protein
LSLRGQKSAGLGGRRASLRRLGKGRARIAFSSEADTASREENASRQESFA